MTLVKMCGLRSSEHALAALEAGADMLGFILAPARRQVNPAEVAAIAADVRQAAYVRGRTVTLVGVFVNERPARMRAMVEECGLDAAQLSGDEPADIVSQLTGLPLLKAVRLAGTPAEQLWLALGSPALHLLVDAHVPGAYGGAGVVADWGRAAELAREQPIVLAGGLSAENVGDAIRLVRPWAVDVSSGVETDGVKDVAKIQAFVAAVRATDQDLKHMR
jgi:phosphoribosylanthranilate isomerase